MGASLSHLASSLETLGTAIQVLRALNKQYRELLERSSSDPGLPPENSTDPYWLDCPPFPELVDVHSAVLPESADVVIVGSGIAAASVAWGLLMGGSDGQSRSSGDEEPAKDDTLGEKAGASSKSGSSKEVGSSSKDGGNSEARRQASVFPRIVVLEARAICSGATGRNGGHIKASPHEVFAALRRKLGARRAAELVRFQLRHLDTIVDLCRSGSEKRGSNHFEVAECREVETVDLLLDDKTVAEARHEVEMLRKWVPEFEIAVWSAKEAREKYGVNEHVRGALSYKAGALWPYRLVTAVWKTLLERFPSRLSIETHTAATAITTSPSTTHPYDVHTSRGSIRARHVVHCTNAFATHLVPGLRGKMTSVLAHMSAQRPGPLFTTTSDTTHFPAPTPQKPGSAARSWSVIHASGFDYVVQRPPVEPDGSPLQTVREGSGGRITGLGGDLMLGGGFSRTDSTFLSQIGVWDDSICRPLPVAHLLGVFGAVFREECWAGRSLSDSGVRTGSASVGGTSGALAAGPALRKAWTGIICLTADRRPFVGRLDARVTGRKCSATPSSTSKSKTKSQTSQSLPIGTSSSTTTPGEWIAAGFVGDGMVWAWLSGMAVAVMLSGRENEDLPAAPGRPAGKLADWFPDDLYATYERVQKADLAKAFAELA